MVIGKHYVDKKKEYFFLKYFFRLWKRWISTGGRSHGLKVFWGIVAYQKWFFFNTNFNYFIWNTPGIIQSFFKTIKMNFTGAIIFYPKLGAFTLGSLEELSNINSFVYHNTTVKQKLQRGYSLPFTYANIGFVFFAIQTKIHTWALFAWSAGCYGKILKKQTTRVFIQLPSLFVYVVSPLASATLGIASKKYFWKMSKAGHSRYLDWIPKVWGIAMNPVDHPHGGRTNKGGHPVTPQGFLTKGVKTRKKNSWSKKKLYAPKTKLI